MRQASEEKKKGDIAEELTIGALVASISQAAAGGVLTAKQAPAGPAPLRRSVCAEAMAFSLYRRPALERRNIMLFSSWLRNSKRSAPAAHGAHNRPLADGPTSARGWKRSKIAA